MTYQVEQLPENIQKYIRVVGHHWIWTGAVSDESRVDKKGVVSYHGRHYYAHRLIYSLLTGFDISSEAQVNHKRECQVSLCCHPDCLYEGTQQDNVNDREKLNRGRYAHYTHCNNCGNELKISPSTGHKYCQVCKNNRRKEWRKRT